MGCPLDGGDHIKIKIKQYALGQVFFVIYVHKIRQNFNVKRSKCK